MKLAALAGLGTFLTGAYVLGVFEGGKKASIKHPWEKIDLPKSLDDFKANAHGYGCIQDIFQGLRSVGNNSIADVTSSPKIQANFFESSKRDEISGCLIVNWNKQKPENDTGGKWKGDFSLLWAVGQKGGKGFIVFATAEAVDDSGKKLSWKGIAYSTEKEADKTTWKIAKKKEESSGNKKMDKDVLNSKFPKADSGVYEKDFWGLMDNNEGLNKVCSSSDSCTQQEANPLRGYWEWKGSSNGGSGKKLGEWTPNLSAWWEELFGKTEWDMVEVVKDMNGTWTKKMPQ